MRLGIFGGTFDPPHLGHLILAAEAQWQLRLDRVLWVLTPIPPHKPNRVLSPLAIRRAMVEAAINGDPSFELSTVDIDRPAPHYAADTLRLLAQMHSGAELVLLVGGDSLRDLPKWYHPQEVVARATELGVMRRPGAKLDLGALERQAPGIQTKIRFIQTPLIEISSTLVRQRAADHLPFRHFLLLKVYNLIQVDQLYR
jgi:nicotinate-nucleotide adenylyltransferase